MVLTVHPVGTHCHARECQALSSHSLYGLFCEVWNDWVLNGQGHVYSLLFFILNLYNEGDTCIITNPDKRRRNSITQYRGRSLRWLKTQKHRLFLI